MFGGIGDEFVDQQRRRDGARHGNLDAGNDLGNDLAVGRHLIDIAAEIGQVGAKIERFDLGGLVQSLVDARDGRYTAGRLLQMAAHLRLIGAIALEAQYADYQLQTVFHPVIDFAKQDFVAAEGRLQIALETLPLDRHAENIRSPLKECQVALGELALRAAVDLQHAEGGIVALQDDVDRPMDTVFQQQLRNPETIFAAQMVGNDRLAGTQGKPRRRFGVRADRRLADDAGLPADAGAHQQAVCSRKIFQNLAEFRLHALRG